MALEIHEQHSNIQTADTYFHVWREDWLTLLADSLGRVVQGHREDAPRASTEPTPRHADHYAWRPSAECLKPLSGVFCRDGFGEDEGPALARMSPTDDTVH